MMKGKLLPRKDRPPSAPRRTFRGAQADGTDHRRYNRPKRTTPWVSNRKAEWKDSDSIALAYKKGDKA